MKTLHLTAIISISVISLAVFAIIMQSKSENLSGVYGYTINDYYPNLNKTAGIDTIKNQTFHFVDENMSASLPRPYWVEMYDTNFTFPNGLEPEITPGGEIFEAYVKFPNESVPYRMAVDLGRDHTSDTSITILSTHTNPQAGYTIYHGMIRLLVNWDKIHTELQVNSINDTYVIGTPINFQINVNGFDNFDAGQTPHIRVIDSNGKTIWQSPTYLRLCCVPELLDYDKQFNFSKLGGPISINSTGSFKFVISYDDNNYEKQFSVISNVNASHEPKQIQITNIRKVVDQQYLQDILSGNPIDKFIGIVFGTFDWSHNGKFVLFDTNPFNPPSYLWTMSSDGSQIKQLNIPKFDAISSIHVSPHDDAAYFVGYYNIQNTAYRDIIRYDLQNNSYSDLTNRSDVQGFDFTPDGNLIYVEKHTNSTFLGHFDYLVRHYDLLWLTDMMGKKIKLFSNGTESFSGLSLSPDGNNLVFFDNDNPLHPADNGTRIEHDLPGGLMPKPQPMYLATFRLDHKDFKILDNSTDYSYGTFKWTKDGNYIVSEKSFTNKCVHENTTDTYYCDVGFVTLMSVSDPLNQTVLYGLQTMYYTPLSGGIAISPDQKSLIFGMDADYYGEQIKGKGIYIVNFENALP